MSAHGRLVAALEVAHTAGRASVAAGGMPEELQKLRRLCSHARPRVARVGQRLTGRPSTSSPRSDRQEGASSAAAHRVVSRPPRRHASRRPTATSSRRRRCRDSLPCLAACAAGPCGGSGDDGVAAQGAGEVPAMEPQSVRESGGGAGGSSEGLSAAAGGATETPSKAEPAGEPAAEADSQEPEARLTGKRVRGGEPALWHVARELVLTAGGISCMRGASKALSEQGYSNAGTRPLKA